jgi:outer membrane protein assembly factor BamB
LASTLGFGVNVIYRVEVLRSFSLAGAARGIYLAISPIPFAVLVSAVSAQEWTRFHGPNGSGIAQTKGVPAKIDGSALHWKIELPGSGHSSPVLWGEKVFVTSTGDEAGGISVLCLEAKGGKIEWKRDFSLKSFTRHRFNSFASSTPAVDSERVYVVWNEPDHYFLTALDHAGKTLWQRDFGPYVSQHGCGTSPALCDGKIILPNFQDDPASVEGPITDTRSGHSSILAVDCKTGKTVWETPRKSTVVSYSTPCIFEGKGGQRALIVNSQSHGISALDPATGKPMWEYEQAFDKRSVSSPLISGEIIIGSCGNGGGRNSIVAIRAGDASSGRKPDLVYQNKKSMPYVPTGIVKDDLIWLLSDGGILTCMAAKTGEVRYQERVGGNFFGSPVWADGNLYCVAATGEIVVIPASDKFSITSRFPLNELCRSTPAVAMGSLFIRTENHLWRFGGPKEATVQ